MKKIKKMLAIVLSVALFTLAVPLGSINLTANAWEEKDFGYKITDDGVMITGIRNAAEKEEIIIPSSIEGSRWEQQRRWQPESQPCRAR